VLNDVLGKWEYGKNQPIQKNYKEEINGVMINFYCQK
jgi:hypothetical protein